MAKVIITKLLSNQIEKKFKAESIKIFKIFKSLEDNPKKGKSLGSIGNISIKEIKYESYRFYFITDRYKIKVLKAEELKDLIIKFVRMSDKKSQQKVIDDIKKVLISLGEEGF